MVDLHELIWNNMEHIIPMSEIIADNFMYSMKSTEDKNLLLRFSSEGQELLEEIRKVIE